MRNKQWIDAIPHTTTEEEQRGLFHIACRDASGHSFSIELFQVAILFEVLIANAENKVTGMFEDEPGVVDLGSREKSHKRQYRVLGIPKSVPNRVIYRKRAQ